MNTTRNSTQRKTFHSKKRIAQERNWNLFVLQGMLKQLDLIQMQYGRCIPLSTFGARIQIQHLIDRTKKEYDKELKKS